VFVGTFTAGDLEVDFAGGRLAIVREGSAMKFVREVEQRTYSGAVAAARGQQALFVTERCVFRLVSDDGEPALELIEVAPGIDVERDILARMAFRPRIAAALKTMDARLFSPQAMARDGRREQA
jgi:propionate CoA-transferase